ncbi:MAG TPA: hypothetical protein VFP05_17025 [Thermomicrobiales bacterium]|nr:hypothetical protein [Thermomicrobiales bacterium]
MSSSPFRPPFKPAHTAPGAESAPVHDVDESIHIAAFGDSVMWGQGIERDQTFVKRFANELSKRRKKSVKVVIDRSRSGAVMRSTPDLRRNFVDTFPEFFPTKTDRTVFLNGDESGAQQLYGEVPASCPSVQWQVGAVTPDVGKTVEVALFIGGANDIDFEEIINPQEHQGKFVEAYEEPIRTICYDHYREQLRGIRAACPNAVILAFSYHTPISYASDFDKIKAFFKYEYDNNVAWWINENIWTFNDVDALVHEGRIRSVWGQARATYWMRRSIAELARDKVIRGPGIVFVPSGMDPQNAAFAKEPEVFDDYKLPTSDAMQEERVRNIPRVDVERDLRLLALHLIPEKELFPGSHLGQMQSDNPFKVTPQQVEDLLQKVHGPTPMVQALKRLLTDFDNPDLRQAAINSIAAETSRIYRAKRASFLHPDTKAARRYGINAITRYQALHDLTPAPLAPGAGAPSPAAPGVGGETLDQTLERFGLRGNGVIAGDLGHAFVDSIQLIIETADDSDESLSSDVVFEIETVADGKRGTRRYRLNFPYRFTKIQGDLILMRKVYPQFEPGTTSRLTISVVNDLPLTSITGMNIQVGEQPDIKPEYGSIWRPRELTLELNGVQVLTTKLAGLTLGPGDQHDLKYPKPLTVGGEVLTNATANH